MTYREKNLKQKSLDVNFGQRPVHIKFDDDETTTENVPQKSKVVSKTKAFLQSISKPEGQVEEKGEDENEVISVEGQVDKKYAVNIEDVLIPDSSDEEDGGVIPEFPTRDQALDDTSVPEDDSYAPFEIQRKAKKKKKKKGKVSNLPPEIQADPVLQKYWFQRYRLFSLYDSGIRMDRGELCKTLDGSLMGN